jgi:ring-1,2-phenylacetyl-CoA epoxidase subunit PaaD
MVSPNAATEMEIWEWLREVPDPEIPVLSIIDLGIVREVHCGSQLDATRIIITPTYSGCPAMVVIGEDIRATMRRHGVDDLILETVLSPAWTTDWMSEDAKERLREYGVAPPPSRLVTIAGVGARKLFVEVDFDDSGVLIACPRCGSTNTALISRYGSTACKALYKCKPCLEPFDAFKCH